MRHGLPAEPSAEAGGEQDFPVSRITRVSVLAGPFRETSDVYCQRTGRGVRQDKVAIDGVLHGQLLLPVRRASEGANYAESLSMIRGRTWPDGRLTRHSRGPGIVPHAVRVQSFGAHARCVDLRTPAIFRQEIAHAEPRQPS